MALKTQIKHAIAEHWTSYKPVKVTECYLYTDKEGKEFILTKTLLKRKTLKYKKK